MKNAFGLRIFEIKEVVRDKKIEVAIKSVFLPVLVHLGFSKDKSARVINEIISLSKDYNQLYDYEKKAYELLKKEGVHENIPVKLSERAKRIVAQIGAHLKKGSVLDFGCGDGKVGEMLAEKGYEVELTDIYENSHIKNTGLRFRLFEQGKDVPYVSDSFDNTLALTVFHHSDNPVHSIKESARVTKKGGCVVVIESVYGVHGKGLSKHQKDKITPYLDLTTEQQRKVNIFFDHFYNRIIHYIKDAKTKVNVPFNFNTPENWKKLFAKHGLKQTKIIHLAIDQPAVPEYHTLHVLRKL